MKRRLIAVPAAGSAALPILSSQPSRHVTIFEDDSAPAQGLRVFFRVDGFVQGYDYAPDHQPIIIGNPDPEGSGRGSVLGYPSQVVAADPIAGVPQTKTIRAADTYCKVVSMGAATSINVTEIS